MLEWRVAVIDWARQKAFSNIKNMFRTLFCLSSIDLRYRWQYGLSGEETVGSELLQRVIY